MTKTKKKTKMMGKISTINETTFYKCVSIFTIFNGTPITEK